MRRRRGAARASSTYEWSGRGGPPATPPLQTSSQRAESSTVRVTQPITERPCQCSRAGASEIRSRCGLSPNRPQSAAGIRIEPPPSDAVAPAQRPAAVAAAEPPLDPPGVREVSHGFRVIPHASVSVKPQMASSGRFVLPSTIAPAARRRRTISPSACGGRVEAVRAPRGDLALEVFGVLDRDGHAGEWQRLAFAFCEPRLDLLRLVARLVGQDDAVRVQLGIEAIDPVEVELDEVGRCDVARADHFGLAGDPLECHIAHRRQPSASTRSGALVAEAASALPVSGRCLRGELSDRRQLSLWAGRVRALGAAAERRLLPLHALSGTHGVRLVRTGADRRPRLHPPRGRRALGCWRHPEGGLEKCFCRECGAHLFSRDPEGSSQMSIRMSAFDEDPASPELPRVRRLRRHVGADPDDGLERYDERKPRPVLEGDS